MTEIPQIIKENSIDLNIKLEGGKMTEIPQIIKENSIDLNIKLEGEKMIEIRQITKENSVDLNIKNEPFEMPGRFIPSLHDGVWSYRTETFGKAETMVFPDENYDFDEISGKGIIFGAYEDGKCIGVAIYQDYWLKFMYLYDLKINAVARGKGVGKMLIDAGMKAAKDRGYLGLYTQAQDNNLNACMFYLKAGFEIGGFDNRVYTGTSQEGKGDIIFYKM